MEFIEQKKGVGEKLLLPTQMPRRSKPRSPLHSYRRSKKASKKGKASRGRKGSRKRAGYRGDGSVSEEVDDKSKKVASVLDTLGITLSALGGAIQEASRELEGKKGDSTNQRINVTEYKEGEKYYEEATSTSDVSQGGEPNLESEAKLANLFNIEKKGGTEGNFLIITGSDKKYRFFKFLCQETDLNEVKELVVKEELVKEAVVLLGDNVKSVSIDSGDYPHLKLSFKEILNVTFDTSLLSVEKRKDETVMSLPFQGDFPQRIFKNLGFFSGIGAVLDIMKGNVVAKGAKGVLDILISGCKNESVKIGFLLRSDPPLGKKWLSKIGSFVPSSIDVGLGDIKKGKFTSQTYEERGQQ